MKKAILLGLAIMVCFLTAQRVEAWLTTDQIMNDVTEKDSNPVWPGQIRTLKVKLIDISVADSDSGLVRVKVESANDSITTVPDQNTSQPVTITSASDSITCVQSGVWSMTQTNTGVDIIASLPAGTNKIGSLSDTNVAIPGGLNATLTNTGVDIIAALPAGTNKIGSLSDTNVAIPEGVNINNRDTTSYVTNFPAVQPVSGGDTGRNWVLGSGDTHPVQFDQNANTIKDKIAWLPYTDLKGETTSDSAIAFTGLCRGYLFAVSGTTADSVQLNFDGDTYTILGTENLSDEINGYLLNPTFNITFFGATRVRYIIKGVTP